MNVKLGLVKVLFIAATCLLMFGLEGPAAAQTWIELNPAGSPPNPVYVAKPAFYDTANNRLIVFFPGNPPYNPNPPGNGNEVWVLTNANGLGGTPAWIKLLPTGSPPFSNGSEGVVYDQGSNRLVVYGGCFANCSPALSNVFVLANANGLGGAPVWSQSAVTNPQARAGFSSVFDSANNLMISFAGQLAFFGTDQNDTRLLSNANGALSPSVWTALGTSGGPPPIRSNHTAFYDQANNRMTIFGGQNLINTCCPYVISNYNDAWVLSNANGQGGPPTWTSLSPLGTPPPGRGIHSAVYDSINNRMIIFGGDHWDQAAQLDVKIGDLWQLSNANGLGGTSAWIELPQLGTPPGPRFLHTAAFDAVNQRMIVLGGRDSTDTPSNRVWVLDLNGSTCVTPPANLVGWWAGDGNANDIAGGNNGTLVNGATFAPGMVGEAFSFDGTDDAVEISDAPNLNPTQQLTLDAWVYPTATSGAPDVVNMIVNKEEFFPTGTIAQYELGRKNADDCSPDAGIPVGNLAFFVEGVSGLPTQCRGWIDGGAFLPLNAWSHVALTFDGSAVRTYVNGILSRELSASGTLATTNGKLRIGARNQTIGEQVQSSRWAGMIDEVEIFNRALSASEIQAIFNAGSAGKCKNVTAPQLTALGEAKVWLGLKNSDDVGTKFDLLAEVFKNGSPAGSGQLSGAPGGSSGFNNAVLRTIDLALAAPTEVQTGDTLSIRLSVRIALGLPGHRSGTARLWFNDLAANSRFDATINGVTNNYFLLDGFTLGSAAGLGPKKTIDVFVDRAVGGNPFKPFGTWSKTL